MRYDKIREQHQIVYPEGVIVLNETGVAIIELCDGRPLAEIVGDLETRFEAEGLAPDVLEFIEPLFGKGILHNAEDPE